MAEITVGDVVRVDVTFTVDDSNTDPTAIIFKYRPPNGSIVRLVSGTDAALAKDATGKFHVDITTDRAGTWKVEWEGTGNVRATRGTIFNVVSQAIDL